MKTLLLFGVIHLLFHTANSQVSIKITVNRESTVTVTSTGNDKEKNTLVIDNKLEKDASEVILKTNKPSTFTFGKNGKVSLNKGENSFTFNSSGLVRGYPDNKQRLSLPFDLTILDENGTNLPKTAVDLIGRKPAKPDTNTVKKENENPNDDAQELLTKIPIYDALLLLDYKKMDATQFARILKYYAGEKNLGGQNLLKEYKGNAFLDSFLTEASLHYGAGLSSLGGVGNLIGKGVSAIGGLDVTSFADGAAKFIVKRAKQELSMAFFQKFKKVIDSTRDIGTIFPQTANLLHAIDDEIYNYEKYIQNLREAFKKDIAEIHRNLPGIIDNHPGFFTKHQVVKAALLSACFTAQELEDQAHPGDIIANYPIEYLDSIKNKNYKASLQTIQLLSASLRDTSTKEDAAYWVKIKQVRDLVNDKLALKIYLGLVYQEAKIKYDGIPYEGTTLIKLLDTVAQKYDTVFNIYNSYRSYVLGFGEKVDALNKMIKTYNKEGATDSAIVEKYAKYFRMSVDLIEYCTESSRLPVIKSHVPDLRQLLKKYLEITYSVTDLVVDINRKNYSAVINHAVHIYNVVAVKSSKDMADNNDFGRAANPKIDTTDNKDPKNNLDKLVRYGSFMATVATARNSDEVQRAIEAAALPVGSSRIKRASDFNVSLNAYAGLFYGVERINNVDSGKWKANVYGVTAPIGIAASWGHRIFFIPTGKYEWSTTLFVSLIDLGAVAAFRFRDDSTSQIPTIRLKHIFSPGVFLSIGIPKTPLSFNLGAQMGPNLRKVNKDLSTGNDFNNRIYWRFSTSICVDIPILNFHTKSK
ncbi:MAG: hypothetical protein H7122_02390 [Chitinophagaceae bacterium]|nr:hypothetical protein [Chitinophagaceae bacterium]